MGFLTGPVIVKNKTERTEAFSLVLGGPLHQLLLLRSRLIEPPLAHLGWRIGAITALAWLPLVALTIFDERFMSGVKLPFLYDFEVQARLLFALPLLVLAEVIVNVRISAIPEQFVERQIITYTLRPAFNAAISSAMRLRDSLAAEIGLLLIVVLAGFYVWREALALHSNTWSATLSSSSLNYTLAGRWYAFVSGPVFQFILLRWYYRVFIWCRFLFQVSRLDLNLVASYPDRCCGFGFLGDVALAFAPLLMAHSGLVAGFFANRILHGGATLLDYRFELVGVAFLLLLMVLGPLCIFIPKLNNARLRGLRTYGRLESHYAVAFAEKWSHGPISGREHLLGSAEIQSLSNLAKIFAVVKETKLVPFDKVTVLRFLIVIALPLAPLAFTMFSVEELVNRSIHVVL
jgi:hypothetical protein